MMRVGDLPDPVDPGDDRRLGRAIFFTCLIVLACVWASDANAAMLMDPAPLVRDIVTCARPLTPTRLVSAGSVTSPQAGAATTLAASATPGDGWQTARASWYGPGFIGNTMAGGGALQWDSMVVAHRSLPFGTLVEISYGGRTCVAVVQDRGPFISGRTFDLGPGTASALGFQGVQTIEWRIAR